MKIADRIKSGLRNLFNHLSRGEGTEELARKPEIIKSLIDSSAAFFDTSAEGYAEMLRVRMSRVKTEDLEYLQLRGVTVGIDARLGKQQKGEKYIDAVFYSNGVKGGTLALSPRENPAYSTSNGTEILGGLAGHLRYKNLAAGEFLYATFVIEAFGRAVFTGTRWFSPDVVPAAYINRHPVLKNPPKP